MSNQGLVQADLRTITGTQGTYDEDWMAYLAIQGYSVGTLNERMYQWLGSFGFLGSMPERKSRYATYMGATNWDSVKALIQFITSSSPEFDDTTGKLDPLDYTTTRSLPVNLADWEGLIKAIPGGIMAYLGARVVTQLLDASDDVTAVPWNKSVSIVFSGATQVIDGKTYREVEYTSTAGSMYQDGVLTTGDKHTTTIDCFAGTKTSISLTIGDAGPEEVFTLQATPDRYSFNGAVATNTRLLLTNGSGTTGTVWIAVTQAENVTGQSNQNPSDYTEGTALYNRENGNTVDGNGVVTEAVGDLFATEPEWLPSIPGSTNLFLNSTAPVTQAITLTPGDWTLSVVGTGAVTSSAGTATGTGYGAATDGTPNTINITVGGTVTYTVAGGPPGWVQVEAGIYVTPPITTTGSSASRDAEAVQAPQAGNIDLTHGTISLLENHRDASQTESVSSGAVTMSGVVSDGIFYGTVDGRAAGFDGTTFALATETWASDDQRRTVFTYSATLGTMTLAIRNVTQGTAWVEQTVAFDGSLTGTGGLIELYKSPLHIVGLADIEILANALTDSQVENRYG